MTSNADTGGHLSDFKPIGYYSAWGMREFDYDEEGNITGSHEVDSWSGEGSGFSWEIRRMTDEEMAECDVSRNDRNET